MTISAKRLADLLVPLGFRLWLENYTTGEISFSRPSSVDELFEHLCIMRYGTARRIVNSGSLVSVTSGPELNHGLSVERDHWELRTNPEEGCSVVSSTKEAVAWEKSFAAFVDQHLHSLTKEVGPDLLSRSENSRATAKKYWKRLRELSQETNCSYLATQLSARFTREQLIEPDRIADAIVSDLHMLPAYQVATMTIQMFSLEVEGIQDPFVGQHVYGNDPLRCLLAILSDLLVREDTEMYAND